ncbi:ribonuclease Y [Candidatus Peregrinibacteria bacterium]|nr:ribonuclease Y [Candidatus Peregrinibacteria bacterium]
MPLITLIVGAAVGSGVVYFYKKKIVESKNRDLQAEAERILGDAKSKSKEILYDARNQAFKIQDDIKKDERTRQAEINKIEERLLKKEKTLDHKTEEAEKLRTDLDEKVSSIKNLREEVEEIYKLQAQQLEKLSSLTKEEARELLLKKVEEEAKEDIVAQIKKAEAELEEKAEEKAKWVIANAIVRCAAETTAESTATIVNLPSDDMKGRIIGREGRNINTFEQMTGVDVIVDDTPGSIVVSGFDLVRRYIAKVALERLIEDGRIHPARIEETVEKVKGEVNDLIKELGEKAMMETGVTGFHPNLTKILGRLKFRVTHGVNALKHCMEVSFIASNLASELGADVSVCKRAGLLHDIGKAVDHEVPGHHAHIGADIARKFGLPEDVIHSVDAHHGDVEVKTLEAKIVQAANLIANARPGANKENLDSYIKRLVEMENLCEKLDGVKKAFAIQAGTEVRIFVNPEVLDDLESVKLSHSIARKIEADLHNPGLVKVHVIREMRAEGVAQ